MSNQAKRTTEQERVHARYNWRTTTEAAAQLGDVSTSKVLEWYDAGLLTGFPVHEDGAEKRDIRFKQEWLDEFEARRTRKAHAA
jgi:hypothetical protein